MHEIYKNVHQNQFKADIESVNMLKILCATLFPNLYPIIIQSIPVVRIDFQS